MHKWILVTGASFSLLSVVLGAFAAHGLKAKLSDYALSVFQTGVQYQSLHGIALLFCGIYAFQLQLSSGQLDQNLATQWLHWTVYLFILGIVFFSGSLYALALTGQKWLGPITPIGGLFFILAWACLIVTFFKQ